MKEIKKIIKLSNKIDKKGFFKISDKIDDVLSKKQSSFNDEYSNDANFFIFRGYNPPRSIPLNEYEKEKRERFYNLDINKRAPIIHITPDLDSVLRHGFTADNFVYNKKGLIPATYNEKKSENIQESLEMISKINIGEANLNDVIKYCIKKAKDNLDKESYDMFISSLSFILGEFANIDQEQTYLMREYLFHNTNIIEDIVDLIPNKNKKDLIYNIFKELNSILSILYPINYTKNKISPFEDFNSDYKQAENIRRDNIGKIYLKIKKDAELKHNPFREELEVHPRDLYIEDYQNY